MTIKQLLFREAARDKIRQGVDALADAVKVTLGPRGRTGGDAPRFAERSIDRQSRSDDRLLDCERSEEIAGGSPEMY